MFSSFNRSMSSLIISSSNSSKSDSLSCWKLSTLCFRLFILWVAFVPFGFFWHFFGALPVVVLIWFSFFVVTLRLQLLLDIVYWLNFDFWHKTPPSRLVTPFIASPHPNIYLLQLLAYLGNSHPSVAFVYIEDIISSREHTPFCRSAHIDHMTSHLPSYCPPPLLRG